MIIIRAIYDNIECALCNKQMQLKNWIKIATNNLLGQAIIQII